MMTVAHELDFGLQRLEENHETGNFQEHRNAFFHCAQVYRHKEVLWSMPPTQTMRKQS